VTQKRCPGGLLALHAGQIAGPSALNDFENLNDGASGRWRTEPGRPDEPGSPEPDEGATVGGLLGRAAGMGLVGDESVSSETLSSDANNADEVGIFGSRCSTRSKPRGGVGGTPRFCGFKRRPQSRQNVKWSAFSRLQTSQITGAQGDLVGAIKSSIARKILSRTERRRGGWSTNHRQTPYFRPISLRSSN
jgi:hypothetical protein